MALVALAFPALSTALVSQTRIRTIDSLMAAYAQPNGPGASLLVIRAGRVLHAKGYGLADVDKGVSVGRASNFRLASLSKQFTATAIMLLVADGKLRYEDEIGTLVPALPAYARGITVRQLLNHTSGLPDYEEFVPDSQSRQVHDRDIPALIAHAPSVKFPPGTRYSYSNSGYVVLGLIVERVAGQPFADFLRDHIFMPLGMSGTVALEEGRSSVPHRAYGYTIDAGRTRRTDQSNTSATLGDGGIYSSAYDLAKWDRALEKHTLIRAAAQRVAWTPPSLAAGDSTTYGFGWFLDRDHGTTRHRHHGESRGFTNSILRYPEKRLTVVILTNRTGGAPWDIAQRIAELYFGDGAGAPSATWRP